MAGEKILVVDDDPGLLMLMRVRLEATGYQVISAEGGKEALTKLAMFYQRWEAGK